VYFINYDVFITFFSTNVGVHIRKEADASLWFFSHELFIVSLMLSNQSTTVQYVYVMCKILLRYLMKKGFLSFFDNHVWISGVLDEC